MRRAARIDANQQAIVKALRAFGISVRSTAAIGEGFPDLTCGYQGLALLLEVKDPNQPPSKRVLTPAEQEFADSWRGHRALVCTPEEAINAVLDHARDMGRL